MKTPIALPQDALSAPTSQSNRAQDPAAPKKHPKTSFQGRGFVLSKYMDTPLVKVAQSSDSNEDAIQSGGQKGSENPARMARKSRAKQSEDSQGPLRLLISSRQPIVFERSLEFQEAQRKILNSRNGLGPRPSQPVRPQGPPTQPLSGSNRVALRDQASQQQKLMGQKLMEQQAEKAAADNANSSNGPQNPINRLAQPGGPPPPIFGSNIDPRANAPIPWNAPGNSYARGSNFAVNCQARGSYQHQGNMRYGPPIQYASPHAPGSFPNQVDMHQGPQTSTNYHQAHGLSWSNPKGTPYAPPARSTIPRQVSNQYQISYPTQQYVQQNAYAAQNTPGNIMHQHPSAAWSGYQQNHLGVPGYRQVPQVPNATTTAAVRAPGPTPTSAARAAAAAAIQALAPGYTIQPTLILRPSNTSNTPITTRSAAHVPQAHPSRPSNIFCTPRNTNTTTIQSHPVRSPLFLQNTANNTAAPPAAVAAATRPNLRVNQTNQLNRESQEQSSFLISDSTLTLEDERFDDDRRGMAMLIAAVGYIEGSGWMSRAVGEGRDGNGGRAAKREGEGKAKRKRQKKGKKP